MFTLLQQAVKHRTLGWQRNLNRLSLVSFTGTTLSTFFPLLARTSNSSGCSSCFFLLILCASFHAPRRGKAFCFFYPVFLPHLLFTAYCLPVLISSTPGSPHAGA